MTTSLKANRTKHHKAKAGWTFVEMLVAVALSSVCLGAGALALQSISSNAKRTTSIVEIDIGTSNNQNFYGNASSTLRTYMAPNFGKLMFAQEMREKMAEDALRSTAVFCLPRSLANSIRPTVLTITGRPNLDSPDRFREFLATVEPTSAAIFGTDEFRSVPATNRPNMSIFMLGQSNNLNEINVNAIYEIDFVTPSNRPGTYASVRRYVGTGLTHYYDIFYQDGNGDPFFPQFVAFEHQSLQSSETNAIQQAFQIAPNSPFYLVWLPDPSINPYKKPAVTPSDPAVYPLSAYETMAGKTSFCIVLPMFPSL